MNCEINKTDEVGDLKKEIQKNKQNLERSLVYGESKLCEFIKRISKINIISAEGE